MEFYRDVLGLLWPKTGMAILSLIGVRAGRCALRHPSRCGLPRRPRERASPDQAGFMAFDLAAEILGGQRSGIRIEPATLMFCPPTTRVLLRTRPKPPLPAQGSWACWAARQAACPVPWMAWHCGHWGHTMPGMEAASEASGSPRSLTCDIPPPCDLR
jgi:hypothetical protein